VKAATFLAVGSVVQIGKRDFTAVLLDIDGTLIDSNDAHAEAWVQALREHDIPAEMSRIRPLIGKGGDKLLCEVARLEEDSPFGKRITRRKKDLFEQRLSRLMPTVGARRLLEFLLEQGVTLVVATSADDREREQLLTQAGVHDLIQLNATKDDAGESKPDPDIVQAALARARSHPDTTVMIGDTPYDIEAAERAGLATIALRCGGYWSDEDLRGAIAVYDDPAHLLIALCGA
jgi:HAD superfamily hydrolase (TIGR01549 family)